VRCAVRLVSQVRTAVVQRGADIPGRPLDGGQATDDRSDRAVLADGLAGFDEVPGIFGGLESVRLLPGDGAGSAAGGVDPVGSVSVMLAISSVEHIHGPARKRWPGLSRW